ncbi:MAG: glycosyltransferase [Propionibacteriaceae bacterium]|nr:glycosyltransferase [Propionibacteriaceae bacterium]
MPRPNLTILLPVHNGEIWLARCLEALLSQTYSDFRLWVLDDDSSDASAAIARRYAMTDKRIAVHTFTKGRGITGTLNQAIEELDGGWIGRMDADDIATPRQFDRTMGYLAKNPRVDIVGSGGHVVDALSRKILRTRTPPQSHEEIAAELLFRNPILHPTVVMRTSAIKSIGGYPDIPHSEDYGLWTKAARSGLRLANIADSLIELGHHEGQVSLAQRDVSIQGAFGTNRRYAEWFFSGLPPESSERLVSWVQDCWRLTLGKQLSVAELATVHETGIWFLEQPSLGIPSEKELRNRAKKLLTQFQPPSSSGPHYFEVDDTSYLSRLHRRFGHYEPNVPGWVGQTIALWEHAERHTIPAPRLLKTCLAADLGLLSGLSGPIVLTTKNRSNYADGVFFDADCSGSLADAQQEFGQRFSRYQSDAEAVLGALPPGTEVPISRVYRVFAFQGEIGGVLMDQQEPDKWLAQLWLGPFEKSVPVSFRSPSPMRRISKASPPACARDLVHHARRLSLSLPTSFARIDMVETSDGPIVLGAQLHPNQFLDHDSLCCPDSTLNHWSALWEWASRWSEKSQPTPAIRIDPRRSRVSDTNRPARTGEPEQ